MDAQQIQALQNMTPGEWRVFVAGQLALIQSDQKDMKGRLTRLEKRRFPGRLLAGGGVTLLGLATYLAKDLLHLK